MADNKISAFSDGATPAGTDAFAAARSGGTTVKLTWTEILAAVKAVTLDQFAVPAAAVAMNAKKITGQADGTSAQDSAAAGQLGGQFWGMANTALAETMPRFQNVGASAPASGTLYLTAISLRKGVTYTGIGVQPGGTGATSPTHQIFGLFDDNLGSSGGSGYALLATSTDDTTTAWAASTVKKLAFTPGTYTPVRSGTFYVGVMQVAGTPAQLWWLSAGNPGAATLMSNSAPIIAGSSSTGLTTALPNPASAPSVAASGAGSPFYAFVY